MLVMVSMVTFAFVCPVGLSSFDRTRQSASDICATPMLTTRILLGDRGTFFHAASLLPLHASQNTLSRTTDQLQLPSGVLVSRRRDSVELMVMLIAFVQKWRGVGVREPSIDKLVGRERGLH